MDLDQIMNEIYVPNATRDRRLANAIGSYSDARNQYGGNSQEAENLYGVLVKIFPEMEKYRKVIDSLDAGFARGEFELLPGDLESLGLKNEW